ncbi:MAG: hypothetical protein KIT17_14860 [Rubrivivax sp.]|nr:hypothetical protein [Rubrivivax sp.]
MTPHHRDQRAGHPSRTCAPGGTATSAVPFTRRQCIAALAAAGSAQPVRSRAGAFGRLPLLPERPHVGPMKPVTSAATSASQLPSGQRLLTIEHDVIRGVTPAMVRWWFENLGKTMRYRGTVYPRYLLWHPRDHIHFEVATLSPGGGAGQGAMVRIVEAFAAHADYHVDSIVLFEKLDDEGLTLVRREFGRELFRLEHRFASVPGGTSYRSRLLAGASSGRLTGLINSVLLPRVFPDAMATAWLTHNVEEVGMLEHVLPALHAARGDA